MRFRVSDILIFALLFVFAAAFPVDLLPIDSIYQLLIRVILRLLILAYYIYTCVVNRINIFKFYNLKRMLLFIPFLLACFSNLIATSIDHGFTGVILMDDYYFALLIVYHFVGAICEEFLFRFFIQNSLVNAGSLKRIFFSAGIFALFHLLNIVNISSVDGLITIGIQVLYTFALGILLGIVYEYTYSLPACITLHFLFNFLNLVLIQYLGCVTSDFTFYMTAIVIGAVLAIYIFVIYWFVLKRTNRYFRE